MSFENPFELFSKSNLFRFPEGLQNGITLQYVNLPLYAIQTSLKVEATLANTLSTQRRGSLIGGGGGGGGAFSQAYLNCECVKGCVYVNLPSGSFFSTLMTSPS